MIRNRVVLNSDSINRYGYRFSIGALEDAMEQKALEGIPTCLGHDMHRPLGWTVPFGLYFEPGLCRIVGSQVIAETDEEQKFINKAHYAALKMRYHKECEPFVDRFKQLLGKNLTKDAKYLYAGCVCYDDVRIAEKLYPKLFSKADKDGLIYLSVLLEKFSYLGHGVFKDNDSEFALVAHRYLRKSLSIHNNLNHFLIDELVNQAKNPEVKVRLALDRDLIGFAPTYHDSMELEYWRGPRFNNDISKIKKGVSVFGSNEFQKLYYGISQTEFWWKHEDNEQVLEVEELKEHPSKGIKNDMYGCRYVHSIFEEKTNSFKHFDGAIRMYDTEKMLMRIEKDIKSAGKNSEYTKLFRIDGCLKIEDWKVLVCHYFQANPLIHEYFDIPPENEPMVINEKAQSVVEKLVPYSMSAGDGVRLLVSYHEVKKREEETFSERYISSFDVLSVGETNLKVIETDILEVVKALKRIGCRLDLPKNVSLSTSEDLYWNIPTISHSSAPELESSISNTLQGLGMIFTAKAAKLKNEVASFSISWERDTDIQVTVSVFGHSSDISIWLKNNNSIPIDREKFKAWLENQSEFLNKYPKKENKPPLSEIVCNDGVQYIKRRGISPDIKYELDWSEKGQIMIAFEFPKHHFELAKAYEDGMIDVALGYIHKKKICSKCNGDYLECDHSKVLDNDVSVTVVEFEPVSIVWTDRKA